MWLISKRSLPLAPACWGDTCNTRTSRPASVCSVKRSPCKELQLSNKPHQAKGHRDEQPGPQKMMYDVSYVSIHHYTSPDPKLSAGFCLGLSNMLAMCYETRSPTVPLQMSLTVLLSWRLSARFQVYLAAAHCSERLRLGQAV